MANDGLPGSAPYMIQDVLRLGRNIHQFRRAGLHSISHFISGDPRRNFRIAHHVQSMAVQIRNGVDETLAHSLVVIPPGLAKLSIGSGPLRKGTP